MSPRRRHGSERDRNIDARAVLELLVRELEINGYKALPCAKCERRTLVDVDELHRALKRALLQTREVQ